MSTGLRDQQSTGTAEPAVDPHRRFELLEDCRDIVISRLARVVSEALDKLSDELTGLAMMEARREGQQALLDAVALVRQHRVDIELRFRQTFSDVVEKRMFNRGRTQVDQPEPGGLALVDDDAIEERIALERLARRAQERLDPDQVLGMRARLAALLDRDWFEENDHPVSPEAVFDALRSALDALAPAAEVRSALLQAFEPHISAGLNDVYSNLNERLISNQVLPTIRPRVVGSPGSRSPAQAQAAAPAAGEPRVAAPAGAAEHRRDVAAGLDAFEALMRQIAAGQPSARRSAARMLADPAAFGVADLPMPSAEPPLIEALNTLQAMPGKPGAPDTRAMTELLEEARGKGSALDQVTIEIVSLVFDYIYADRLLPDFVKQQLLRLQVVAMKAALIDRSFFARRQHPMRRLIDRISGLATDPDADVGPESNLCAGVTGIVDWVIEHFEADLATFEEAIRRLDLLEHAEEERRAIRMAQVTREAERIGALSQAQEEARADIALRIDPVTPAFVREFLYRWWSRAIAHARVDSEDPHAAYAAALRTSELLIWSVAPKSTDEIARLAAMLPKLIGGLMQGLKTVGIETPERERFFNELLQWHTRAIKDAKANAGRSNPAATTAVRIGPDGEVRFEAPARPAGDAPPAASRGAAGAGAHGPGEARVDALNRGDLIELDEGGGARRTFRLAWVSPSRNLFVLTRFPDAGRSLSRNELVGLFDSGRARRASGSTMLDRAIEAVAEPETS